MARIIHTDNFAGDYPDEKFVEGLPRLTAEKAKVICDAINSTQQENSPRFYVVVEDDYTLKPGFEP
jgi:hypothetical protein